MVSIAAANAVQTDSVATIQCIGFEPFVSLYQHVAVTSFHLESLLQTMRAKSVYNIPELTQRIGRHIETDAQYDCTDHVVLFHHLSINTMY